MSEQVDAVLNYLSDGKWHEYSEISQALGVPEEHVASIVQFLTRFGFIDVEPSTSSARAKQETKELIQKTGPEPEVPLLEEEGKETVTKVVQPGEAMSGKVLTVKGLVNYLQATSAEVRVTGKDLDFQWREELPKDEVMLRHILEAWEMLNDGEWHDIEDVGRRLHVSPAATKEVLDYLRKPGFVVMHDKWSKVKASFTPVREVELR